MYLGAMMILPCGVPIKWSLTENGTFKKERALPPTYLLAKSNTSRTLEAKWATTCEEEDTEAY